MVGMDYAADMLAIAHRKRDGVGLTDRQLSLIEADATKLDLGEQFDWVCVFFNTFLVFTTIAKQDAVLQAVLRHLKPAGRFWLDIFQPDLRMLAEPVREDLDPSIFFVPRFDRTVMKRTDIHRTPTPQIQHVTFRYNWFDAHGQEHHHATEFDMTYIFPRELQLLLEPPNGLKIEHQFGNYDGSPLNPESPRIIVRAKRGDKR